MKFREVPPVSIEPVTHTSFTEPYRPVQRYIMPVSEGEDDRRNIRGDGGKISGETGCRRSGQAAYLQGARRTIRRARAPPEGKIRHPDRGARRRPDGTIIESGRVDPGRPEGGRRVPPDRRKYAG